MQCQSAERLPDADEVQPEFYEKDKGSAGIHGQLFEYKFCALLFLRATNIGYKFKLASNAKGFGAFDDVVVEYLDDTSRKSHIFLQLKSKKEPKHITIELLRAEKGDFCLRKYYESYIQIEEKFNSSEEGVKIDGRIDESLFIIYTNADVGKELKCNKATEVGEEEFLMTGGFVLQFDEEEHKDIYEHLQELPKHREFLCRFRIFYSQAGEKKMDCHIKRELQQSMQLPDTELELAYMFFLDFIKDWWQNSNFFLKETNCMENDPLQKTSEKVRTTLVAKILDQRKYELDELNIKYKESAIRDMKQLIQSHKALLIFAPGRSTTLTAAKIHQMLSGTTHSILNLQQLVRYKSGVMSAWKHKLKVMVLESESCDEDFQEPFSGMSVILNECDVEKKFIFISSRKGNIQQISALRSTFSTNLTERYDDWKFADIDTESRKFFLQKKVYFQGSEVKLSNIVKEHDVGMFNALDSDTITLLLEKEKTAIGIPIEDTVEYYIDRTLQCRRDMKPRFPIEGQMQHALNGDILQESQDIRSHRKENLKKRDTPKCWEPRTLLDCVDRLILVVDEPGMGKSTLLTHLAKETRNSHPETWIVRVNLNNSTMILHDIKIKGSGEEGAIKLLTKSAQINEHDGLQLEEHLFHYSYNSTGNMAVLIDGVDEVSPHYTKEVTQILKILYKTKIKNIWVTSRNSVKGQLEQELQCQSYSLVPFSEEDQKRFLVKFWSKECVAVPRDHLENLAQRVVELSIKHLRDGEKNFMGLPLQSMLLAEMFEENLKHFSTSVTSELPEYINLVMLYQRYVEKKWDIYLSEKKRSDRTNVNVKSDDNALHDIFIDNHKSAAFVAILSTHYIKEFTDITTVEKARLFIQKIDEGEEKTGIITDVIEGRPVFQHRTLAEYFVARWLCANIRVSQTFMRDHIFESGFGAVRDMLDRILADKCPLHKAVLNSNLRYVERLLRKKESISDKDHEGRTPLHIAVSCRRPELIRILLEHGADVRSVDNLLGLSPLGYANRMDDWEMLSLMMEKRPDIRELVLNRANHHGMETNISAFRAAAKYGHNDLLKYLISKGNSVNMVLLGDNSTLLHEAARSQHTDTVKMLVKLGASTDCQDASGKTPLHVSVETGSLEVTKCIVESQVTVQSETEMKSFAKLERTTMKGNLLNIRDIDGNTALHLAAAAGNTNIVSYLVSAGSDLNTCNEHGEYPLTLAARCGKNDIVELLLKGDTDVKCEEARIGALTAAIVAGHVDTTALLLRLGAPVCEGENEKPIHVASRLGREKIIALLLQHGASLMSHTDSGNTALHLASEAGHLSLVRYLVEREGDDMNSLNYENQTPLHLAARNGRECLVNYFLENGCNVNATSANSSTYLHVACENGHYTTVEYLLKHGAKVNAMNSADRTPLQIAASLGQTDIVELMSLHNANFSLRDTDGITALLAASRNGHQDTVRFIVQHGGNIEDTDGKGNTIAHFAVANDNHDILKFLSKQDANLDVQNSDGDTPLLQAVREGRNRIVQYLVDENLDINTQGNDGMRPLDVALLKGNTQLTRLLLERNSFSGKSGKHIIAAIRLGFPELLQRFVATGEDINVKTEDGESPLHVACKSGQVATVQYLSEHGALLDLLDNSGNTALHVAVKAADSDCHVEIVRELLNHGASVDITDENGCTPLYVAALKGHVEVVREFLNHGANVNITVEHSCTPLYVAALKGHVEVVRELLNHGAIVNITVERGCTPLYVAALKGHVGVVREFLNHGAIVNITAEHGCTPLYVAALNGHVDIVPDLLNHGASVDVADEHGCTPLYAAALNGHVDIARVLLKHGASCDIANEDGWTPLEAATLKGHVEISQELRKCGAGMQYTSAKWFQQLYLPCGQVVMLVSLLLASFALIFCLWLVVLEGRFAILCPEECRCDPRGLHVECSNLSLNNIRLIIPTSAHDLLLTNNNITSLEKNSFISRGLTELDSLTVKLCELETIELGAFNGLTQLTNLTLSFNRISVIIPRTFEKMSRLEHLDLAYNRLEHLEVDVFSGLSTLKHIHLEVNKLQYLHPDTFIGLHKLEYLKVAHNPDLQVPTDRPFINSHSLSLLDISNCNVSSVSVETFANVSALEWLEVRNNNLSSVDINILKVLPNLSVLCLYGNQLQCDCQLQEVWRWCQDHNIQTASGESAPECDTPSVVQGIWWGVLEKGQCLQGKISYYGDYENTSYRYNPAEDTDNEVDTDNEMDFVFNNVKPLVYAVLFIFGTAGNAILLIIITCNKDMRTVPNMYILNLAISDMICLIVHFAESSANTIPDTWLEGEITCTFFTFYRRLSVGLSAYSEAVLSILRYRVVLKPFSVRVYSQLTWRDTAATICGVWILAALFALPSALSKGFCNFLYNYGSVTYYHLVVLFELLVSCVLPVCVIAFSYTMTACNLVMRAQPISEETQNSQLNTRKNTAAIVLGLTVVFLISYVPYHVLWSYVIFNTISFSDEYFVDNLQYTYLVSTYLLLLNPCLNPVALFSTSLAFRRQFKRYLTCFCKANPTASNISNIELTRMN